MRTDADVAICHSRFLPLLKMQSPMIDTSSVIAWARRMSPFTLHALSANAPLAVRSNLAGIWKTMQRQRNIPINVRTTDEQLGSTRFEQV